MLPLKDEKINFVLALCDDAREKTLFGFSCELIEAEDSFMRGALPIQSHGCSSFLGFFLACRHSDNCAFGKYTAVWFPFLREVQFQSRFPPCVAIARSYLEKAVAQRHIKALADMGIMPRIGDEYVEPDKVRAGNSWRRMKRSHGLSGYNASKRRLAFDYI